MRLEELITTVYCLIDDMLFNMEKLRQRGPSPRLSDSEVITMELIGEMLGMDADKVVHYYFKSTWLSLFPNIGDRSAFVRQAANLWAVKKRIREKILTLLIPNSVKTELVDGFPVPTCGFRRAYFSRLFKGDAAHGYCASKSMNYYGFKGHLLATEDGVIIDLVMTAANVDEREALFEMRHLGSHVLGDKGYIVNKTKQEELALEGIHLETPLRANMKDSRSKVYIRTMQRKRRLIETVISQLTERFNIQRVRARDLWHLTHRLSRKIVAHTLGIFINRSLGHSDLQFARLFVG